MKCPKCGFNSFEFHDVCKKCSNDLVAYRETYGLKPLVIPQEARPAMAMAFAAEPQVASQEVESAEADSDLFSFDLPEDDASSETAVKEDPFSFINDQPEEAGGFGDFSFDDEEPSAPQAAAPQAAAQDDEFSNLLESTSIGDDSPFGDPSPQAPPAAAAAPSAPGEFDLNNFSWDEPETPQTAAQGTTAAPEDDFDSLFGESDDSKK